MKQLTLNQAFGRTKPKPNPTGFEEPKPSTSGTTSAPSTSKNLNAPKIIFGLNGPHADFNQFSPHAVAYNGAIYPTCQHLFQAARSSMAIARILAEMIRVAPSAEAAVNIAHLNKSSVRSDWASINVAKMEKALFLKFSQHPGLGTELLKTGNAELYQDSMTDSFWGIGPDLLGCNELGQALERVREGLGGARAPIRKVVTVPGIAQFLPIPYTLTENQTCP
ncbi:hypothetical protein C8J57DRAFT_1056675 [Mycena rebaudengoi]|nr:hypothetical protein C8J57DRAFT_1056675 [Mycena rebaudengoi]